MKHAKQQNDPLWRNGQTTTSRDQLPNPEHNDPVVEAQQQNARSNQQKRNH